MNKTFKLIFVAIMAIIMVTVMTFVGTARNIGFGEGFFISYFKSWLFMVPIAYITALVAIPVAEQFTKIILKIFTKG